MNKVKSYEFKSDTDSTADILMSKAFNSCAATLAVYDRDAEAMMLSDAVARNISLVWLVNLSERWVEESRLTPQ